MFWRIDMASLVQGLKDPETGEFSSNFKLLGIAAGFLVVTIGLIFLQPGQPSSELAQNAQGEPYSQSASGSGLPDRDTVTRLDTSLFSVHNDTDGARVDSTGHQPIRLTEGNVITYDLRSLTATVLTDFGHVTRRGDPLHELLVQALANQQSDAYIDALLNTAAGRGDFRVPVSLLGPGGRLDTPTLLQAIKVRSRLN